MSDYFLNKIYESILQNKNFKDKNFKTLAESYNAVYEQETEQQITPVNEAKKTLTTFDIPGFINNILTKALEEGRIKQIKPVGNYSLENLKILPEDMPAYTELFAKAPPTATGVDNSKNSGNGELALFWLLNNGKNTVQDTRGGSKPDLTVNGYGVEVKAISDNWINLGRFGSQNANLKLLSILFGLDMILNITGEKTKRPPSLEDFDKDQLIKAFESVSVLDKLQELRNLSFVPIKNLYSQVDYLLRELNLISGKFNATEGAARILLKVLKQKLTIKPGVGPGKPGYIANCDVSGKIDIHIITQEKIDKLSNDQALNNIRAKTPMIQLKLKELFPL